MNSKFNLFHDEVYRIYNTCCPIKTKEISPQKLKKPWITTEVLANIRHKYDLFKRYKAGQITYDIFQSYKSVLKKKLKKAKKDYYMNKFKDCQGDSASTWKITNNILNNKNKSTAPSLIKYDRKDISDQNEMCKIFNNFFVNIGANLANTITRDGTDPLDYLEPRRINSFIFSGTTPQEVFNIIKKFKNKKATINNIPIAIIKKIIQFRYIRIMTCFIEDLRPSWLYNGE